MTSLELEALKQEAINDRIQAKYRKCEEEDARYEAIQCDDAEYIFVAYGSAARICMKSVELARAEGIKVGLIRPITLWPFPTKAVAEIGGRMKKILSVEITILTASMGITVPLQLHRSISPLQGALSTVPRCNISKLACNKGRRPS